MRIAALCWIANLQFFVIEAVAAARFHGGYSWSRDLISDLGNTHCGAYDGRLVCSPLHGVMDLSFVVLGVTMIAGASLLASLRPSSVATRVGLCALSLGGVGVILVGAFPENVLRAAHTSGAIATFVFGNLGLILVSRDLSSRPWLRFAATASGAGALAALLVPLGLGNGTGERITAYPQTIWMALWGISLIAHRRARRDALTAFGRPDVRRLRRSKLLGGRL